MGNPRDQINRVLCRVPVGQGCIRPYRRASGSQNRGKTTCFLEQVAYLRDILTSEVIQIGAAPTSGR